ncbi:M20/M25/M40 family metallo-hydrolase [Tahibacter harae]|uniref:M20/M25/M40 family metallo-hydrolase n=1 Tax=Tahibacter harae TaxID=2963937 RepID=A0ABT1QKU4_9GAMM|nr:M20/M25/M40 family metallo-hydrolase [Tahibacter harae]MCQ4163141.1 M20/M25/M40 family metallo-hydrolase [Tahibacter harae]
MGVRRRLAAVIPLAVAEIVATVSAHARGTGSPDAETVYIVTARQTYDAAGLLAREATAWKDSLGRELVIAQLDPLQIGALSRHVHEREQRCGGFFAFASRPEAEAFIVRDRTAEAIALPLGGLYTIDNQATVGPWLAQVSEANIHATITTLSAFRNRYYASPYGRQAAEWIRDSWQALAAERDDATVELFQGCSNCSTQPSVILTVRGAELPDEVVVLGGHLDSITSAFSVPVPDLEQPAPGADDDASGIATLTEIIRISLASGWKPRRTVKFMGYAAEEVGLRGSAAIANRFRDDGINVIGVLQLDMTNYRQNVGRDLRIVSDFSNTALTTYFAELFDAYLVPLGGVRSALACNYGCSDHASWTSAGFPAGMVFEAGRPQNPNNPWDLGAFQSIHSTADTLANMGNSASNSVRFAQFGLAFAGELGKTYDGAEDAIFSDDFEVVVD